MLLFSRTLWERPATPVSQETPMVAGHDNPGIAVGEPHGNGRLFLLTGTDADESLDLRHGAFISGGGGNDVFVLEAGAGERLGVILDFSEGDKLDLRQLGDKAQLLDRVIGGGEHGGDRIGVDIDGDGKEDAWVTVFAPGAAPDLSVFDRSGVPVEEGEFHILPFPMPGDGVIEDGEFHILPFPMPGDGVVEEGEYHILPFPFPAGGTWEAGSDGAGFEDDYGDMPGAALVLGPVSGATDWLA
ncbi:hypothetical protein [Phenylobacterium deserti]|uniref:Uncharacterized protein n=1 Tax=Phenylobacterium deserti TaxID=1914756 RepID=A0A328ANG4_9CAUL|nr:hypothetical protein [Phenylobacterium deserti]RAK56543.1 hypothetical protein DJ018_00740 [Phenylobacterium deserti]